MRSPQAGDPVPAANGPYFLGIDIGSNESKGVLIDTRGQVVASHACAHSMEHPRPHFFEHDAEAVWWGDFCKISQALLKTSGVAPGDIACVGMSALGADCLPVDENCRPLRKAILYGIDARATAEMAQLSESLPPHLLERLDTPRFTTSDIPPKILWLKHHEPETHEAAHKFLSGSCYLAAKLTGRFVTDRYTALAGYAPFYREDGSLDEAACTHVCRPDQLPDYAEVTDIVGRITAGAARETGLAEGTPVLPGTDDAVAESISAGLLAEGDATLMMGSTLYIATVVPRRLADTRIGSQHFAIPGTAILSGVTNAAGNLTQWVRDTHFPDAVRAQREGGPNAYDFMMEAAAAVPPGAEGLVVLPYFAGERTPVNDADAKGVFYGLTLRHTREHIYRAVLEAVGYSVAQHIEIFAEHGVRPDSLTVVGGGTKTPMWMQIIADITGIPVKIPAVTIGASYADAIMAGIGAGRFEGFSVVRDFIKTERVYTPDPQNAACYRRGFRLYNRLYPALKDIERGL